MSGPVCAECGAPWGTCGGHAISELAWRGLCGLVELAVILTLVIIVGTLLV